VPDYVARGVGLAAAEELVAIAVAAGAMRMIVPSPLAGEGSDASRYELAWVRGMSPSGPCGWRPLTRLAAPRRATLSHKGRREEVRA